MYRFRYAIAAFLAAFLSAPSLALAQKYPDRKSVV